MIKGIIKLCYKKLINSSSSDAWSRLVFEETHNEYFMQWQEYDKDKKYANFSSLRKNNVHAENIHYLVSTSAIGYLRQLNGFVPDILDSNNKVFLPFKHFKFEIIESHFSDKTQHQVLISFYSEEITWVETIGTMLLVTNGDQSGHLASGSAFETDQIQLSEVLRIFSIRLPNT
jgi:hypothetical protein